MGQRKAGRLSIAVTGIVTVSVLAAPWMSSVGAVHGYTPIERVSVATDGTPGDGASYFPAISDDGTVVAFMSNATNLVPDDGDTSVESFVHDTTTDATHRLSVSVSGGGDNATAESVPAVSGNGRYVVWSSNASNLVHGDTNGDVDLFRHDLDTGTTELVGLDDDEHQPDLAYSGGVSDNGRFVSFVSEPDDVPGQDFPGPNGIFLRDIVAGTTTRVSESSAGAPANNDSYLTASMSDNGRFVPFATEASNLVPVDTNLMMDLYVRDTRLGTTERASLSSTGDQPDYPVLFNSFALSRDGRRAVFLSQASNLVADDTNDKIDAFVRDLDAETTTRVNLSTAGAEADKGVQQVGISDDGRFVAFRTAATNMAPGDTNPLTADVFVRDTVTNTTTRVSQTTAGGEPNANSTDAAISGDGTTIAFSTYATDVIDGDTNGVEDVVIAAAGAERQPDLTIRRPGGRLIGDDVYGRAIADQTVRIGGPRGERLVAFAKVANDGDEIDDFTLRGTSTRGHPLQVRYYAGRTDTDITRAVKDGTYRTGELAPGESATVRIEATFGPAAPQDLRFDIVLRARSATEPAGSDGVRATLRRR